MLEHAKLMDILLRTRKHPFSVRFGEVNFLEHQILTDTNHKASDDYSFISKKGIGQDRIDFSNDSFGSNFVKDDEDSYFSGNEKDLVTPDIASKFPPGKNFPCPYKNCKKIYTSSYGLKYHMDHGHTAAKSNEKRPYVCRIGNCGKTYKNNNGLKYHILHAHRSDEYDESEYII